jgi:DNA mismatch repair protein MutS
VSIAWATAEYIHEKVGARTLFATHYHEMAQLADFLSAVRNLNVAVREWQGEVIFLHRIVPGHTDQSYGIHVAKIAGVPQEVVERAKGILGHLEENAVSPGDKPRFARKQARPQVKGVQMPLFRPLEAEVRDELLRLDTSQLTPLQALQKLEEIKRKLGDKGT